MIYDERLRLAEREKAQLLEVAKGVLVSAAQSMRRHEPVAMPVLLKSRPTQHLGHEPPIINDVTRLKGAHMQPLLDTLRAVPPVLLDPAPDGRGRPVLKR